MSSFGNFVQCQVVAPITIGAVAIDLLPVVAPYTLPPVGGGLVVLVDSPGNPSFIEVVRYTARSGQQLQGVTRGQEGTVARAWSGTVFAFQSLMAADFQALLDAKQASNTNLNALSGLAGVADRLPYFTGAGALSLATLTSLARNLLDDTNQSEMQSTLGLVKQTSATDTAVGSLLTVGAFGRNGGAAIEPAFASCNSYVVAGDYNVTFSTTTDCPDNSLQAAFLRVTVRSNGVVLQELLPTNSSNDFQHTWYRTRRNDGVTWDAWVKVWDSKNTVKQTSPTDATAGRLLTVGASAPHVLTNLPIGGSKNKIINGTGRINQRNTSPTTTGAFGPDRWVLAINGTSLGGMLGSSVDGSISLNGPHHFFLQTQIAKATLAAGDYMFMQQTIEGFNVANFKFGTPQAKQITLSFRATGTFMGAVFSVSFRNGDATRSYVVPVTLLAGTNTYTVTLPGDLIGTWATGNLLGLTVSFAHAASQTGTFTTSSINQWVNGNFVAANTQSNGFDTVGKALSISDVQLEVGAVATPFENRPYGQELALCQRYYEIGDAYMAGAAVAGVGNVYKHSFAVAKRAVPTLGYSVTQATNVSAFDARDAAVSSFTWFSLSIGAGGFVWAGQWTASAEL
jgi:hypothetical protein